VKYEINNGFPVMNPDTKFGIQLAVPLVSGYLCLMVGVGGVYSCVTFLPIPDALFSSPFMIVFIIGSYLFSIINSIIVGYFSSIFTNTILERY